MIIITVKGLDEFFDFMSSNRASNHVFYEVRQAEKYTNVSIEGNADLRVLNLHFLGTLGASTVLFQHVIEVQGKKDFDAVLERLHDKTRDDGISFIEGTIREIFMSIS